MTFHLCILSTLPVFQPESLLYIHTGVESGDSLTTKEQPGVNTVCDIPTGSGTTRIEHTKQVEAGYPVTVRDRQ